MECKVCGDSFFPSLEHLDLVNKCLVCGELICGDCARTGHQLCLECRELDCASCRRRLYTKSIKTKYCKNCDLAMHPICYRQDQGICQICRSES